MDLKFIDTMQTDDQKSKQTTILTMKMYFLSKAYFQHAFTLYRFRKCCTKDYHGLNMKKYGK